MKSSYWQGLLERDSWLDYLGIAALILGLLYLILTIWLAWLPSPRLPVPVGGGVILTPISVIVVVWGVCCVVAPLKKRVAIPVLAGLMTLYIVIGTTATKFGLAVHYKTRKLGIFLAVLLLIFILAAYVNAITSAREHQDNSVRERLLTFLDSNPFGIQSRASAVDLYTKTSRPSYSTFNVRRHYLSRVVNLIGEVYEVGDLDHPLSPDSFTDTLRHLSQQLSSEIYPVPSEPRDAATVLDVGILLSFHIVLETSLSVDGTDSEHTTKAYNLAKKAELLYERAADEAKLRNLPRLSSLDNSIATAKSNYFILGSGRTVPKKERVDALEEAYSSYKRGLEGSLFSRQRAANNLIDLELKILRAGDSLCAEVVKRGETLGATVELARTKPFDWLENNLSTLSTVEGYVRIPEVVMTRLQAVSAAAVLASTVDLNFCKSPKFSSLLKVAKRDFNRAINLGFRDCSFFSQYDNSGLAIIALCGRPDNSLCAAVEGFLAADGVDCKICAEPGLNQDMPT